MRRTPMRRKTPMRKKRSAVRRANFRTGHGLPWVEVREIVYKRADGMCEICSISLDAGFEAHHRLTRRLGPDCPCNVLALCRTCHCVRVHGRGTDAREQGWIVSASSGVDPREVATTSTTASPVFLDCLGGFHE